MLSVQDAGVVGRWIKGIAVLQGPMDADVTFDAVPWGEVSRLVYESCGGVPAEKVCEVEAVVDKRYA